MVNSRYYSKKGAHVNKRGHHLMGYIFSVQKGIFIEAFFLLFLSLLLNGPDSLTRSLADELSVFRPLPRKIHAPRPEGLYSTSTTFPGVNAYCFQVRHFITDRADNKKKAQSNISWHFFRGPQDFLTIVHLFRSIGHVWVPWAKTTGPIVKKCFFS
jgi:hypothetical protein